MDELNTWTFQVSLVAALVHYFCLSVVERVDTGPVGALRRQGRRWWRFACGCAAHPVRSVGNPQLEKRIQQ